MNINIICEEIEIPKENNLTIDDVFVTMKKFNGYDNDDIFGDIVPYKSVTVICNNNPKEYSNVKYWLEYVLGYNCISKTKNLTDNKIAIRANYTCW